MWTHRIPTRYWLWAALSLVIFVAAGCIDWVGANTVAYWNEWSIFFSGHYGCTTSDLVLTLIMWGLLLAVPSIVLGWIAQALVGVIIRSKSGPCEAVVRAASKSA